MQEGIIGGTFDPVHLGHLRIARVAMAELGLSRVVFLPDGDPPHKRPDCSGEDRLAMLCLACGEEPRFQVSDMELRRQGRTYTVDTLLALKALAPDIDIVYLIGSDTLYQFPTWRTAREVARLCRMAIVLRPGDDRLPVKLKQAELARDYGLDSILLAAPGLDISSSIVREALHSGRPIDGLVPESVAAYIQSGGLYRHLDRPNPFNG